MSASAVAALSAVAASGISATNGSVLPTVISALASFAGAALAAGGAYFIAHLNRAVETRKEAVRRAFDTAGSHMATVAFDRYVEFCEEYTKRYYEALQDLIQTGPAEAAMVHARDLATIRQKWTLWVTADIKEHLKKFEDLMYSMGTEAMLTNPHFPATAPNHGEMIHNMHRSFCLLMGLRGWNGEKLDKQLALDNLMDGIRNTLGTNHFGQLREQTIEYAIADFASVADKPAA
jgi:hypothetical protein